MEFTVNGYLKIKLLEVESFIPQSRGSYEQIGEVLGVDALSEEIQKGYVIKIGDRVYFDAFMAKKYPVKGNPHEFEWFVHRDEVVKVERDEAPKNEG